MSQNAPPGNALIVTDGTTQVSPVKIFKFEGATVSAEPGGVARVAVSGGFLVATASLTAVQIKSLTSSPPLLIPAPGAGNAIQVLACMINYKFGTAPYGGQGTNQVYPAYTNAAGPSAVLGHIDFTKTASQFYAGPGGFSAASMAFTGDNLSLAVNQPVVLAGDDLNSGSINSITLGSAHGLGYAPGDTGMITTFSGNARYIVDSVGAGGAVATLHIDPSNRGTEYDVSSNNATSVSTGGGDGNLTVNITAITQGDGTAIIVLNYQIVTGLD